jgi:uncharacterized cupin superfamily protein
MSETPIAVVAATLPMRVGTDYPEPHNAPCRTRSRAALGEVFGLTGFGVNLLRLPPGSWSSQRHWHSHEEELVYVLEGTPTLITDAGETPLAPGMCAGFRAGAANGHQLVNRSDRMVVLLEVGGRSRDDVVEYSDIDMRWSTPAEAYTRRDGTRLEPSTGATVLPPAG